VVDGLLLKADHLREAQASKRLHVEDLLHRHLKLQERDQPPVTAVHHGHSAFQLRPSLCQRHPAIAEVNQIFDRPTKA
jgi:hypothetical protein